ncbi:MAG: hypothetical protein Q7U28_06845 [Aquabacterium sp.]|nr:hypothetical protein [Aquabacterium sp.]
MIILSDTDIVHKLACCELLLEFLQYLKCPPNEVWVLPALEAMLKRKLKGSASALLNVDQFMRKVKKIPAANVATLERFPTLDVGEQQLLAILCDHSKVQKLVTGDKRALDSIAALTFGDQQLKDRLDETSIFCFEAIMLGLLEKRGFSVMQARIHNKWANIPGQKVDGVIEVAFPPSGTEEHAKKTLRSAVNHLKVRLPPLPIAID